MRSLTYKDWLNLKTYERVWIGVSIFAAYVTFSIGDPVVIASRFLGAGLCYWMAGSKNRSRIAWSAAGFTFGIPAFVVLFFMSRITRKCSFCLGLGHHMYSPVWCNPVCEQCNGEGQV